MPLQFLERELAALLAKRGREDVTSAAVGSIGLTDDGGTIYVHLFPKAGSAKASGRAFVLAWEDYTPAGSHRLYCYRWLINEARTSLRNNIDDIARWLEGK